MTRLSSIKILSLVIKKEESVKYIIETCKVHLTMSVVTEIVSRICLFAYLMN